MLKWQNRFRFDMIALHVFQFLPTIQMGVGVICDFRIIENLHLLMKLWDFKVCNIPILIYICWHKCSSDSG